LITPAAESLIVISVPYKYGTAQLIDNVPILQDTLLQLNLTIHDREHREAKRASMKNLIFREQVQQLLGDEKTVEATEEVSFHVGGDTSSAITLNFVFVGVPYETDNDGHFVFNEDNATIQRYANIYKSILDYVASTTYYSVRCNMMPQLFSPERAYAFTKEALARAVGSLSDSSLTLLQTKSIYLCTEHDIANLAPNVPLWFARNWSCQYVPLIEERRTIDITPTDVANTLFVNCVPNASAISETGIASPFTPPASSLTLLGLDNKRTGQPLGKPIVELYSLPTSSTTVSVLHIAVPYHSDDGSVHTWEENSANRQSIVTMYGVIYHTILSMLAKHAKDQRSKCTLRCNIIPYSPNEFQSRCKLGSSAFAHGYGLLTSEEKATVQECGITLCLSDTYAVPSIDTLEASFWTAQLYEHIKSFIPTDPHRATLNSDRSSKQRAGPSRVIEITKADTDDDDDDFP